MNKKLKYERVISKNIDGNYCAIKYSYERIINENGYECVECGACVSLFVSDKCSETRAHMSSRLSCVKRDKVLRAIKRPTKTAWGSYQAGNGSIKPLLWAKKIMSDPSWIAYNLRFVVEDGLGWIHDEYPRFIFLYGSDARRQSIYEKILLKMPQWKIGTLNGFKVIQFDYND